MDSKWPERSDEIILDTLEQQLYSATSCPWQRLLVAFSGGLDSSVLLHGICCLLQRRAEATPRRRVLVVHVNHHLHSDCGLWQQHCEEVARVLKVSFISLDADMNPASNSEQAARKARYAAFEKLLRVGDLLLLAHHQDDQAETLLYRLLRGRTARGMPQSRRLGSGALVRPLLNVPRSVLAHYACVQGLEWIDDPTNEDVRFDRNFLRHQVLPLLRERWPDSVRQLAGISRRLALERQWLDDWFRWQLDALCVEPLPGTLAALDLGALMARDETQHTALLRHWLARLGMHEVSSAQLAEVVRQSTTATDRQPYIALRDRLVLQRYRQRLYLVVEPVAFSAVPQWWNLETVLELANGTLKAAYLDAPLETHPGAGRRAGNRSRGHLKPQILQLQLRYREGGERLTLAGHSHSKSLKSLFQEAGIPAWQRAHYPLLFCSGRLAVVPGLAVAQQFASDTGAGWQIHWHPAALNDVH